MRVGELCVRDVVTAHEDEPVTDAARRMSDLHVGDLIVIADQPQGLPRPIGIVTDRDLVIEVLAHPERVPASTKIADVMRRDLIVATEDDAVEDVIAKMREHSIRRIPIVDSRGGLQGLLSVDDVIGWMKDQLEAATKLLARQGRGPQFLRSW